jgi:hypothetical protein
MKNEETRWKRLRLDAERQTKMFAGCRLIPDCPILKQTVSLGWIIYPEQ